jgi:PST family polysaccharide transporter
MRNLYKKYHPYFKESKEIQAIIQNSSWLVLDKILRLFLGIFVNALVARYLGPNEFGELAFTLAYISIFQVIASFGLDGVVVRDISKDKSEAGIILGTAFTLRSIIGILVWMVAVIIAIIAEGNWNRTVMLIVLIGGSLIFQSGDTVDLWFQSQSQSRRTVAAKIVAYSLANIIKLVLVLNNASILYFAAVVSIEALISCLAIYVAYRRFPCEGSWKLSLKMIKRLICDGWPFVLSGMSVIVYTRIDQIMIKEILGVEQLGIYAAVLPLATVWQFIPMVLMVSVAPYVARKKNESEEKYVKTLELIFNIFAAIGWIICILMLISAGTLVHLLFGDQYENGVPIIMIYIFSILSINLGVAQGLWILNESKSIISLYKTLIGALVCVVGNLILLPKIGIKGAAVTSILSMFSAGILSNIFFARNIMKMQIKALLMTWIFKIKLFSK